MKKTALITGASSGIGEAFAHVFAAHHYNLILLASNPEKLSKIAEELVTQYSCKVVTKAIDFNDLDKLSRLMDEVLEDISVDVVVNNAGFGARGTYATTDLDKELAMIHVNVSAMMVITKKVLPRMISHKSGGIINVSSTAAFQPGPFMSVYFATKAFILSFSEAIAEEIKGTGVHVTTLCPGPTATHFFTRARIPHTNFFSKKFMLSPSMVAEIGYKSLLQKKRVVVVGRLNAFGAVASRYFPRHLIFRLMQGVHLRSHQT